MAYKIIDTCTACGLCVPECPIDAISVGDPIYLIDDTCCDFEDCLAVCPVDAIVRSEAEEPRPNSAPAKSPTLLTAAPGEGHSGPGSF